VSNIANELEYYIARKPTSDEIAQADEWLLDNPRRRPERVRLRHDRDRSAVKKRVICEECGHHFVIGTVDHDGVLIGDPCPKCGYYVTRYMPGQEPK
jgi:hypothetical protein